MTEIIEWSTGKVMRFFKCGGSVSAQQFEAMDADTEAAFLTIRNKVEEDRMARIIEGLTSGLSSAIESVQQPAPAEEPAEVPGFPGISPGEEP